MLELDPLDGIDEYGVSTSSYGTVAWLGPVPSLTPNITAMYTVWTASTRCIHF